MYFCIGVFNTWKDKHTIHVTINKLKKKCKLKWLCTSMSYHRFTSLLEAFAGDLTSKLNKTIDSKDFENLPCTCNASSKTDDKYIFNGKCRISVVIYKATCNSMGKSYIGNTQQKVKKRIEGYLGDVCNLANKNQQSDSFAWHFVTVLVEIFWQGSPI